MAGRRKNQRGTEENDESVASNTRSSGRVPIAYDDNAGIRKRTATRDDAAPDSAENDNGAANGRNDAKRRRTSTEERSVSPEVYYYDALEEQLREAGARDNRGPNERLLRMIATLVIEQYSNRVIEYINLYRNNQHVIDDVTQGVIQELRRENLNQPNEEVIGRYFQRALTEQDRGEQPVPPPPPPPPQASSSRPSTDQGSQGGQVQRRRFIVAPNEIYSRRMLLQEGSADGSNWRNRGYVDYIYRGGRSVECRYSGISDDHAASLPPQELSLDYLMEAQRVLHEE